MWQKYYRIAERQFQSGKKKTFDGHAQKALQCARADNNKMQIAETLALIGSFRLENDSDHAGEVLEEAVTAAEQAYGASAREVADQLMMLAIHRQYNENNFEHAESLKLRAFEIFRSADYIDDCIEVLDSLMQLYIDQNDLHKAESTFLKALSLRKQRFGATSEEVASEIDTYADLCEALGRLDEAAALRILGISPCNCVSHYHDHGYPEEIVAILAESETDGASGNEDLDAGIACERERLLQFEQAISRASREVPNTDPFFEIKLRKLATPARMTKSSIAQLLRLKAERTKESSPTEFLLEAKSIWEELLPYDHTSNARLHYLMTLMDLAQSDVSFDDKISELLDEMPECAASLYSKALLLFRRHGSTVQSRAAMRDAIRDNIHVPMVFAGGVDPNQVPNHSVGGEESEAAGYCLEAWNQWQSTPGAFDFLIQVLRGELPRDIARAIDSVAPQLVP